VHIRRARPDEAEALTALIMRSKAHWGYDQRQLDGWRAALTITAAAIERDLVYCAVVDEMVAGVMHLKLLGETEALLDDLFIEPASIGAGVGGALWRQATILARASGARTIVLDADIHAVAFYQHMGAVLVDIADSVDIPIASTPRMRYELPITKSPD
jgi:N-acetylglutamate synthase-like GNAT family acetyltransferase